MGKVCVIVVNKPLLRYHKAKVSPQQIVGNLYNEIVTSEQVDHTVIVDNIGYDTVEVKPQPSWDVVKVDWKAPRSVLYNLGVKKALEWFGEEDGYIILTRNNVNTQKRLFDVIATSLKSITGDVLPIMGPRIIEESKHIAGMMVAPTGEVKERTFSASEATTTEVSALPDVLVAIPTKVLRERMFNEKLIQYHVMDDFCLHAKAPVIVDTRIIAFHMAGIDAPFIRHYFKTNDRYYFLKSIMSEIPELLPPIKERHAMVALRSIGDTVFITPTIRQYKKDNPDVQLDVIIETPFDEMLYDNPHIDNIITVDSYNVTKFGQGAWLGYYDSTESVAFHSYDKVIDMCNLDMYGGYNNCGKSMKYMYADLAGVTLEDDSLEIIPPADSRKVVNKKLGMTNKDKYFVIHAGGGWDGKVMYDEKFKDLVALMNEKYPNHKVVSVGGGNDAVEGTIDATLKLTFREIYTLMKNAVAFIGGDSGMLHLASAANTPQIGIFGSTHPEVGKPTSDKRIICVSEETCDSPCHSGACKLGKWCINYVEPDILIARLEEILMARGSYVKIYKGTHELETEFENWKWSYRTKVGNLGGTDEQA